MKKYVNLIVDGSNTAHRADNVLDLTSPSGERVAVVYGVVKMLLSIQKKYPSAKMYVVWDRGLSKARKKIFSEYKKKKKEMTDEERLKREVFKQQAEVCKVFCKAMGISSLEYPNTEADDIIYLLSDLCFRKGKGSVMIISSDKDFLQLVNENTDVYDPIRDILYTDENFEELTGMRPYLFALFRAITGDASDGIPGVPRMGKKRTLKVIKSLSSGIDSIVGDKVLEDKWAEKVRSNAEIVFRNMQLIDFGLQEYDVSLRAYVDSAADEKTYPNFDVLEALLKKYAFQIDIKDFLVFAEPKL